MTTTAHAHDFPHWPFDAAVDQACFLCEHVHSGGAPILTACHDHDGDWQFLCGEVHAASEAVLVCLGCAVERHKVPLEVADLPRGWAADRVAVGERWTRERLADEDDDEDEDGDEEEVDE